MWWVVPAVIAGVKFMGSVKERQDKEHWADVRAGLMEDTAQENLSNAYTALAGKRSLGQQDIFAGMGERIAKNSEFASKSYGDAAQVIASGAGSGAEINAFSTPAMIASNVINDADMAIKSNTTLMKVESQRQLSELKFMTRCITETLRLWSAISSGTHRVLSEDDEITGLNNTKITLKKGTYIQIYNWLKHRSNKLWGPDSLLFNPDRDFKDNEIWKEKGFAYYNPSSDRFSPFTYAPRDCIGKNFAQMEMRLILLH